MLVLSRHEGESIEIAGGLIKIMVVGVKRDGSIRIGIDAPREMNIVRSELLGRDKAWRKPQVIPHSVVGSSAVDAT